MNYMVPIILNVLTSPYHFKPSDYWPDLVSKPVHFQCPSDMIIPSLILPCKTIGPFPLLHHPQYVTTSCHVSDQDGAEPNTNSVSALNLLRLSHFIHHEDWREMAGRTIGAFSQTLEQVPIALPQMLCALLAWHTPMKQVRCVLLNKPKMVNLN